MIFQRIVKNPDEHVLVKGAICHYPQSGYHKMFLPYKPPAIPQESGIPLKRKYGDFHTGPAFNRQGAVHYAFVIS